MAEAVARAKTLRVAPRKMRLVANLIRGKKVSEARDILRFVPKAASPAMSKVLGQAVANAESKAAERRQRLNTDDMIVKLLTVGPGPTMRRYGTSPKGRGVRIRKRTCHIEMVIADE